jgi:hypothetical protein
MKIVYAVVLFSLFLFTDILSPSVANAVACQNNTTIVFSNGMFTDKGDAFINLKKLKDQLAENYLPFSNPPQYAHKYEGAVPDN